MPDTKRHATLLRKAEELSILCDAEVAVIAFTSDGKLREYSSNSVEHTLSRYNYTKGRGTKMESDDRDHEVLDALEGQHVALELDKLRRTGKAALDELSRKELYDLEQEQKGALVSVLKKKEERLARLLHRSKERENEAIKELEILKKEMEILKRGLEERTKEIPYLQLFPENSTGLCTRLEAVSVSNCPTQDMDIDHLRLTLGPNL